MYKVVSLVYNLITTFNQLKIVMLYYKKLEFLHQFDK